MSNSPQKRTYIVARSVDNTTFENYAKKMESVGLDPVFDQAPLHFNEVQNQNQQQPGLGSGLGGSINPETGLYEDIDHGMSPMNNDNIMAQNYQGQLGQDINNNMPSIIMGGPVCGVSGAFSGQFNPSMMDPTMVQGFSAEPQTINNNNSLSNFNTMGNVNGGVQSGGNGTMGNLNSSLSNNNSMNGRKNSTKVGSGQIGAGGGAAPVQALLRLEKSYAKLHNLTLSEKIQEKRHERALARWEKGVKQWEQFREKASIVTNRPKEALVITNSEEYREKQELMELIDHVTPEFIKSGGYGWYQSLRNYGARLITIGNLFSGLYLFIKMHRDYSEELIRKPWLRDLIYWKRSLGVKSWRDNPYLVARKKRYQGAMEELVPGKLDYDEVLEIFGQSCLKLQQEAEEKERKIAEANTNNMELQNNSNYNNQNQNQSPTNQPQVLIGPKIELSPAKLEFFCQSGKRDSNYITLKNMGSTVVFWEIEELLPLKLFEESVSPTDPTNRFVAHVSKGKILPKSEVHVHVTFLSETAGCFTSRWRFHCRPFIEVPEFWLFGIANHRHLNFLEDFKEERRMMEVEGSCGEIINDCFKAVKVTPFPYPPDLSNPQTVELHFEERNPKFYYTPAYYDDLQRWVLSLRERRAELNLVSDAERPGGAVENDEEWEIYQKRVATRAPSRGHIPTPKPKIIKKPFVPEFDWEFRLTKLEVFSRDLDNVELYQDNEGIAPRPIKKLKCEQKKLWRSLSNRPLEKSPLYIPFQEEVKGFCDLVIGDYLKSKQTSFIEAEKPIEELPEFIEEFCSGFSLESQRSYEVIQERPPVSEETEENQQPNDEGDQGALVTTVKYTSSLFDSQFTDALDDAQIRDIELKPFPELVSNYIAKKNSETVDVGGQIVYYELDLDCCGVDVTEVPIEKPPSDDPAAADDTNDATGGPTTKTVYTLSILDKPGLIKRITEGLAAITGGAPKAVFIGGHIDSLTPGAGSSTDTAADAGAGGGGGAADANEEVQDPLSKSITSSYPTKPGCCSLQPLAEIIQKNLGLECVFLSREDAANPELAAQLRNTEAEEEELKRVYLLENLSEYCHEIGSSITVVGNSNSASADQQDGSDGNANVTKSILNKYSWAEKEAWLLRCFPYEFDVCIQDSFSCLERSTTILASSSSSSSPYTTCCYLPSVTSVRIPQRIVGPYVDAAVQLILSDVLKLSPEGKPLENQDEGASPGDGEDGANEEGAKAPTLTFIGSYVTPNAGTKLETRVTVLEKLNLITNLRKSSIMNSVYYIGGRISMIVYAYVFGIDFGEKSDFPKCLPFSRTLCECIANLILGDGSNTSDLQLFLPLDYSCHDLDSELPDDDPKKKPIYQFDLSKCKSTGFTSGRYNGLQLRVSETGRIYIAPTEIESNDNMDDASPGPMVASDGDNNMDEENQENPDAAANPDSSDPAAASEGPQIFTAFPSDRPHLTITTVGPNSLNDQIKTLLNRSSSTLVTGSLSCLKQSTSFNQTSDHELWDYIEFRMQPPPEDEEEEEEEEEEQEVDDDGNPIGEPKTPKPFVEKPAEFENSFFIGGALCDAVVGYKGAEHSYSGLFGGGDFVISWLCGREGEAYKALDVKV